MDTFSELKLCFHAAKVTATIRFQGNASGNPIHSLNQLIPIAACQAFLTTIPFLL